MVRAGVAALLAAALLAAASVDAVAQGDVPTRAEFVEEADNICEVPYRKALRQLFAGMSLSDSGEHVRGGKKIVSAGRLFLRTNKRLATLDRPPADVNVIGQWLDGTREGFEKVKKGGKALKAKHPGRGEKLLERANRTVRRAGNKVSNLGFSHCF